MVTRATAPVSQPHAGTSVRRAAAVALTIVLAVAAWAPLRGAADTPPSQTAPLPPIGKLTDLAPGLDRVAVSSKAFDVAASDLKDLQDSIQTAADTKADAVRSLLVLGSRDVELTAQLDAATARARRAGAQIAEIQGDLRALAVANYISGNATTEDSLDRDFNFSRHNELGKQHVMVSIINSDKVDKLRVAKEALDKATHEADLARNDRRTVREATSAAQSKRDQAADELQQLGSRLIGAAQRVDDARRLAVVDVLQIPLVVLDAYVKAAQVQAFENPSCGIQWWAMAGIGLTESNHGTSGGSSVRADGSLTKPILGIPLDGTNSTAAVPAAGGFDRAQGPMQFISSTWARWGRDGDGNGTRDIQNFYDAAAGAAAYLCAGGAMKTDADLERGYFSYNHSIFYVALVLARAHGYEQALTLPS